jgi:hypothetical protein
MKLSHISPAEAERRKITIMRQATAVATAKYGGVEKTHRYKPKPVTLADPERVKQILDRED